MKIPDGHCRYRGKCRSGYSASPPPPPHYSTELVLCRFRTAFEAAATCTVETVDVSFSKHSLAAAVIMNRGTNNSKNSSPKSSCSHAFKSPAIAMSAASNVLLRRRLQYRTLTPVSALTLICDAWCGVHTVFRGSCAQHLSRSMCTTSIAVLIQNVSRGNQHSMQQSTCTCNAAVVQRLGLACHLSQFRCRSAGCQGHCSRRCAGLPWCIAGS